MNSGCREKQAAAKQTEKMIKVRINMTSKERAELKTQAMKLDSIFQIGKASLTPAMVNAVKDALHARELIKVSVLKNCLDDPHEIAQVLAERTGSEVVQVIGKKIVLYKKNFELEEKRKRALKREKQNRHGAKNMKKSDKVQKSFSKPDKRSAAKGKKSKTDQGTAKYLWGDK